MKNYNTNEKESKMENWALNRKNHPSLFEGISWVLKARADKKESQARGLETISHVYIKYGGIGNSKIMATDGYRFHVFSTASDVPEGTFKVDKNNTREIVLSKYLGEKEYPLWAIENHISNLDKEAPNTWEKDLVSMTLESQISGLYAQMIRRINKNCGYLYEKFRDLVCLPNGKAKIRYSEKKKYSMVAIEQGDYFGFLMPLKINT